MKKYNYDLKQSVFKFSTFDLDHLNISYYYINGRNFNVH